MLAGLHAPVPALSFEFTPEFSDATRRCVEQLMSIGAYEFNVAFGESMRLERQDWIGPAEIVTLVERLGPTAFGDVYARLSAAAGPEPRP